MDLYDLKEADRERLSIVMIKQRDEIVRTIKRLLDQRLGACPWNVAVQIEADLRNACKPTTY